jgi:hypothetical protein
MSSIAVVCRRGTGTAPWSTIGHEPTGASEEHAESGVEFQLYEGNVGPGFGGDVFHGNQLMNTLFQNYFLGTDPGRADDTTATSLESYVRYLAAKPAWWPSTKAWPPIGPDVTGGNITGLGGHASTIPAEDCFRGPMAGPVDGSGNVLTFTASGCYGAP